MITNNISTIRAAARAEECTESCAATSSLARHWWQDHHQVHANNSRSPWNNNTNTIWNLQNPSSNNSSGEEDVSLSTSFTNASNHSGLTVDYSSRRLTQNASTNKLIVETPSDSHLWNRVFLTAVNNGELHNNQDHVDDNIINAYPSKNNLSSRMFDPACDYLKKMDNGWEFTNTTFNNFDEKNFNGFSDDVFQTGRLTKLSNLGNNYSLAPPDSEVNSQFDPRSCDISLSPTLHQYPPSDVCYLKPIINRKLGSYLSHDHEQREDVDATGNLLRRGVTSNGIEYDQMEMNNEMIEHTNKFYHHVPDVPCNNGRNLAEFSNCFSNKPPMNVNGSKPLKSLNLSDSKNQALHNIQKISTCNTKTRNNKRGQGPANEGKKKRSSTEENSETVMKKHKHESSAKVQIPKAKLGDKITALQQIVSPFGKTDTASVLWETVNYIKFLQEQVQLLSNPYMKTNTSNKMDSWGGLDRKDRCGEVKADLKSRGLCLVPVSCTPQVYRDNTGPDYLTPAYRGCIYR